MASSICCQCRQRIVGKGFELKGKTYCGGCYSEALEKIEKTEEIKKDFNKYLIDLYQIDDIPLESLTQIDAIVNNYKDITYIKDLLFYYYNILGNEIKYSDLYYLTRIIGKYSSDFDKYLLEKKEIEKKNQEIDLKNIPSQTIIIKKNNKTKRRKTNYKMEDL